MWYGGEGRGGEGMGGVGGIPLCNSRFQPSHTQKSNKERRCKEEKEARDEGRR